MIKVGLIGCGSIAKKHIQTVANRTDIELIALSDLKYEKMKTLAEYYKKHCEKQAEISLNKEYQTLIFDPKVDVVIITTTSSLHAQIAKQALIGGKHVIVEKPLALSLEDINEMQRLATKYQKHLFVCHQLRYSPLITEVKRIIENNLLGEIYYGVISLRLNRSKDYYLKSDWRGTWSKDGGMLINQGIHLIDLLIWLLGDVTSVYGDILNKVTIKETEDIALGIVTFTSGAKGLIEANTITKPKNIGYYLSLFGEKGTVIIGGEKFNKTKHCYIENFPELNDRLKNIESKHEEHELMYNDFIRTLAEPDYEPKITAKDGQEVLEVIFALYESALKAEFIQIPINHSTDQCKKGGKLNDK